jgi:hypothetical protein
MAAALDYDAAMIRPLVHYLPVSAQRVVNVHAVRVHRSNLTIGTLGH